MTTTTTTRYWENDNGSIVCEDHAGSYLSASIAAHPKAKSHRTPLGTWYLMSDAEVADFQSYIDGAAVCETCRYA